MTELEKLTAEYSDMFKDTYGVRPHGNVFYTKQEAEEAMAALFKVMVTHKEED